MQSVVISVAVGLLAFAMGLLGLYLKRRLPEHHMSMGSRDMTIGGLAKASNIDEARFSFCR